MKGISYFFIATLLICFSCFKASKSETVYFARTDTLVAEMVTLKKSDEIYFYIINKQDHINLDGLNANVILRYKDSGGIPVRILYNHKDYFKILLPKEYWKDCESCELHVFMNGKPFKFVFNTSKK